MYGELVVLYEGDRVLGEMELHQQNGVVWGEENKAIRISHYSPASERCPPLAVLHTINSTGPCFKLESTSKNMESQISLLHANCLRDNKTAVAASITGGEIHLVAMHSRKFEGQSPCFWGFNVASKLYSSCLVMLNLRCLGIVFDLDETLIVANTMRSFEDKIEVLQRKINSECDPQRVSAMLAEVKRYQDDKNILKQYAEGDQMIDNGRVVKSQPEVVPALLPNHQPIVRPLIRLQDRNIILTRINPLIRDTSVLVRVRPAWEELRSYLTAKGRKRFEVFVCTMAERDYAIEMWRLLDLESNLINSRELLDRIICVKSGSRKSLVHVFQNGNCHPKMALVIDDRVKVWDERDQLRVHVVPAFAPYHAPQAEANSIVPVLCVARNVACNVRGGFFKEFDDCVLQQISEVAYEDDMKGVPSLPDVRNYLISEKASSASSNVPLRITNVDSRIASVVQYAVPSATIQGPAVTLPHPQLSQVASLIKTSLSHVGQESVLRSSPAREEGELPESELDPDTRRRLLILQHGQDVREHPPGESQFPSWRPVQVPVPRVRPRGWFPAEEEMSPGHLNRATPPKEFPNEDALPIDETQAFHIPFHHKEEPSVPPGRVLFENQRLPKEALSGEDQLTLDVESGQVDPFTETSGALQDIACKCGAKMEFRQALLPSTELQFFVEVLFAGEKIGEGSGRTRREAQFQAAEGSLLCLAHKYLSVLKHDLGNIPGDGNRFSNQKQNGFLGDVNSFGFRSLPKDDTLSFSAASGFPTTLHPRVEPSKRSMGSIEALKGLCIMEGLGVAFQTQPQFTANPGQKNEVHAQVEINGQILGKGIGRTWEEAKSQAADMALGALKSMLGQISYRHPGSPRSMQGMPNKRPKPDFSRVLPRMPSSSRYRWNS